MRLSRHAKNRMRLYRLTAEMIQPVMRRPSGQSSDVRGNALRTGVVPDGRTFTLVVARDRPDFLITVIEGG